jgi:purine-binding chemotaxis protein CheW
MEVRNMQMKNLTQANQQYIIFLLGEKKFGVNIKQTREILSAKDLTYVPDSPDYVRGIINLRGSVVPVVDLHLRLEIAENAEVNNEKIIIIEMDGITAGMLVDDVEEIKGLTTEDIVNLPELAKNVNSSYIEGVGRSESNDELLLLLDLENVLSNQEIKTLKSVNSESAEQSFEVQAEL